MMERVRGRCGEARLSAEILNIAKNLNSFIPIFLTPWKLFYSADWKSLIPNSRSDDRKSCTMLHSSLPFKWDNACLKVVFTSNLHFDCYNLWTVPKFSVSWSDELYCMCKSDTICGLVYIWYENCKIVVIMDNYYYYNNWGTIMLMLFLIMGLSYLFSYWGNDNKLFIPLCLFTLRIRLDKVTLLYLPFNFDNVNLP